MNMKRKNHRRISLKLFDYIFIIVSLAAIAFSFDAIRSVGHSKPVVVITSPSGEYVYSLDSNAQYEIMGKLGVSKIVVHNGSAYFADSPCPNKTCVQCAPISRNGEWTACLPNGVFIRVENSGDSSLDAVAF